MLAVHTVGPTAGLQDLCDWINRFQFIEPDWNITERQQELMTGLCKEQGWEVPETFSLSPINSPAALLHWRCLKAISNQIARGTMEELRERFAFPAQQAAAVEVQEVMKTSGYSPGSAGRSGEEELEGEKVPQPVVKIFDSHFHLDRLRKYLKLHPGASVPDIEKTMPQPTAEYQLRVSGGVAVYCDPETYPSAEELQHLQEEGLKVVVGAHPKHRLTEVDKQRLGDLLVTPGVIGLGEIGLDHTLRPEDWYPQEQQLKELLSYLYPSMVLVLHIRGMKKDVTGVEVFMRCLDILQLKGVIPSQKIQLHCFSGTEEVIQHWLEVYPNTFFSVSGLVFHFNDMQKRALKAIPQNRLLLETDAPYFPVSSRYSCSAPHLLDITARRVAELRGDTSMGEILTQTVENAREFFC